MQNYFLDYSAFQEMKHRRFRNTCHISLPLLGGLMGLLFLSCSHRNPAELAGQVAKQYYEQLLSGDYDSFVDGTWQPDPIPASYRDQLIDNAKMFVEQQQVKHRGIREVRTSNAEADSTGTAANVFLVFCYGDSTAEEVLVPMIQHEGTWYMK